MTTSQWVLALLPLLPLALAPIPFLPGGWKAAPTLAPGAALFALFGAWTLPSGTQTDFPWLLLGGSLYLDDTGRIFLLFTALLWGASGWYAAGYTRDDPERRRFFVLFLISMGGNFGVTVAGDLLTFFLAFAVLSFVPYGLVVHSGSVEARRAGRIYMILVVAGEVLLLSALLLIARESETYSLQAAAIALAGSPHRDLILSLLLMGFGLKAGVVPLHLWLPLAHPAAPVPASAVLSGALIKAGLLGLLRFLPLGVVALPSWGALLVAMGLLSAFWGALCGVVQTHPKTVLAYSSISQMGLITVGLGLGLAAPAQWPLLSGAVLLYALHHGLAKGALFLGVGVAPSDAAPRAWPVTVGLALPALALAGAPLTSGAAAKVALKTHLPEAPGTWLAALPLLLSVAAVGTTLLMARYLFLVLPREKGTSHRPTAGMLGAWGLLSAAVVLIPWLWPPALAPSLQALQPKNLLGLSWPLLLGIALAAGGGGLFRRGGYPRIPAGDLLVPLERVLSSLSPRGNPAGAGRPVRRTPATPPFVMRLFQGEELLARWPVAGGLFLLLLLLHLLLSVDGG